MIDELFKDFSKLNQVEAIALGGSRAGNNFDEKSDYDVYVYCSEMIPDEVRREILSKYCTVMEIGNHFWEYEDNCVLNDGIDIDVLYRNIDLFNDEVASVVEKNNNHNGYTTCMWNNLLNCKIIYDENNRLFDSKKRFNVLYPQELKKNIITQNRRLLDNSLPAYKMQLKKAMMRNDYISINHRTSAFFESYFDILFALNEKTHPGEKRLINLVIKSCEKIPVDFELNIKNYFSNLFENNEKALEILDKIIYEIDVLIKNNIE